MLIWFLSVLQLSVNSAFEKKSGSKHANIPITLQPIYVLASNDEVLVIALEEMCDWWKLIPKTMNRKLHELTCLTNYLKIQA